MESVSRRRIDTYKGTTYPEMPTDEVERQREFRESRGKALLNAIENNDDLTDEERRAAISSSDIDIIGAYFNREKAEAIAMIERDRQMREKTAATQALTIRGALGRIASSFMRDRR